ncbi:hypothetical protein A2U01_0067175, partial [Trifolium medium]|nr:hypothetical protein [Trifolium medium]
AICGGDNLRCKMRPENSVGAELPSSLRFRDCVI